MLKNGKVLYFKVKEKNYSDGVGTVQRITIDGKSWLLKPSECPQKETSSVKRTKTANKKQ